MVARPYDHLPPALAAGQHAGGQGRKQARADQGRLAAARGTDNTDQPGPTT
jgi:hypothetical protein